MFKNLYKRLHFFYYYSDFSFSDPASFSSFYFLNYFAFLAAFEAILPEQNDLCQLSVLFLSLPLKFKKKYSLTFGDSIYFILRFS